MKVLHINAGLENGGGLSHIVNLLTEAKLENQDWELLTLAKGPVSEAAQKKGIKRTPRQTNACLLRQDWHIHSSDTVLYSQKTIRRRLPAPDGSAASSPRLPLSVPW